MGSRGKAWPAFAVPGSGEILVENRVLGNNFVCFPTLGQSWVEPGSSAAASAQRHTSTGRASEKFSSGPFLIYLSRSQSRVSRYEGRCLDQATRILGFPLLPREGTALVDRPDTGCAVGDQL